MQAALTLGHLRARALQRDLQSATVGRRPGRYRVPRVERLAVAVDTEPHRAFGLGGSRQGQLDDRLAEKHASVPGHALRVPLPDAFRRSPGVHGVFPRELLGNVRQRRLLPGEPDNRVRESRARGPLAEEAHFPACQARIEGVEDLVPVHRHVEPPALGVDLHSVGPLAIELRGGRREDSGLPVPDTDKLLLVGSRRAGAAPAKQVVVPFVAVPHAKPDAGCVAGRHPGAVLVVSPVRRSSHRQARARVQLAPERSTARMLCHPAAADIAPLAHASDAEVFRKARGRLHQHVVELRVGAVVREEPEAALTKGVGARGQGGNAIHQGRAAPLANLDGQPVPLLDGVPARSACQHLAPAVAHLDQLPGCFATLAAREPEQEVVAGVLHVGGQPNGAGIRRPHRHRRPVAVVEPVPRRRQCNVCGPCAKGEGIRSLFDLELHRLGSLDSKLPRQSLPLTSLPGDPREVILEVHRFDRLDLHVAPAQTGAANAGANAAAGDFVLVGAGDHLPVGEERNAPVAPLQREVQRLTCGRLPVHQVTPPVLLARSDFDESHPVSMELRRQVVACVPVVEHDLRQRAPRPGRHARQCRPHTELTFRLVLKERVTQRLRRREAARRCHQEQKGAATLQVGQRCSLLA